MPTFHSAKYRIENASNGNLKAAWIINFIDIHNSLSISLVVWSFQVVVSPISLFKFVFHLITITASIRASRLDVTVPARFYFELFFYLFNCEI